MQAGPRRIIRFERMAQGPFTQLLRVPVDGFRWEAETTPTPDHEDAPGVRGPWLVHPAAWNTRYEVRQYAPMAVPHLHRRFARLKPAEDRILAFANRYGMLTHGETRRVPSRTGFL